MAAFCVLGGVVGVLVAAATAFPATGNTGNFTTPTTGNTGNFTTPTTSNTGNFTTPTTSNTGNFTTPTTSNITFTAPTSIPTWDMPTAKTAPTSIPTWDMPTAKTAPTSIPTWDMPTAKTAPTSIPTWDMPTAKTAPTSIPTWDMPTAKTAHKTANSKPHTLHRGTINHKIDLQVQRLYRMTCKPRLQKVSLMEVIGGASPLWDYTLRPQVVALRRCQPSCSYCGTNIGIEDKLCQSVETRRKRIYLVYYRDNKPVYTSVEVTQDITCKCLPAHSPTITTHHIPLVTPQQEQR